MNWDFLNSPVDDSSKSSAQEDKYNLEIIQLPIDTRFFRCMELELEEGSVWEAPSDHYLFIKKLGHCRVVQGKSFVYELSSERPLQVLQASPKEEQLKAMGTFEGWEPTTMPWAKDHAKEAGLDGVIGIYTNKGGEGDLVTTAPINFRVVAVL